VTRKALETLKSIAMGEYKPVEEAAEEVIKDEAVVVEEVIEDLKEEAVDAEDRQEKPSE
jgi:hypothetical protein